ncbi:cupin domain-containing protein [Priestia sp. FSL H7-0729]
MDIEFPERKYGETGVKTSFEQMANGEQKYKMIAEDGSYYCRTVASSHGAWQNSHFHTNLTEFYVVQSGWIAYANFTDDQNLEIRVMGEGDHMIVEPGVHHNIYMSAHSVIHTIKYGLNTHRDWSASPELDSITQTLMESELLQTYG